MEPSALLSSPVKTVSPLSGDGDSLTFFSLPQSESQSDVVDMSNRIEAIPKTLSARTGQLKSRSGRVEKVERSPGGPEQRHGSIPDVAATLPLTSDSELHDENFNGEEDDDADDIAETLHRSQLSDAEECGDIQSFMLVDHNEELQVCI